MKTAQVVYSFPCFFRVGGSAQLCVVVQRVGVLMRELEGQPDFSF